MRSSSEANPQLLFYIDIYLQSETRSDFVENSKTGQTQKKEWYSPPTFRPLMFLRSKRGLKLNKDIWKFVASYFDGSGKYASGSEVRIQDK